MSYVFFQRQGGATTWECALASQREKLTQVDRVEFTTVLDVDNSFVTEMTLEDSLAVKYHGPFYADFDGDIEEVLGQVKVLLLKLKEERGLDPAECRWYFTGGRGVHLEIPMEVFMAKVPKGGVASLPGIYKEMAYGLYVDTWDLRIYSAGRGRMWRTSNVKRSNGLYKVQVTPQEVLESTPERYAEICATPRAPLSVAPPTFNAALGLLYNQSTEKVAALVKKRKARKSSATAAQAYNGEFPDSIKLLMAGEGLKDNVGWNLVAMQLASFALAIGKSEDQLVEDSHGLLHGYVGDSERYGTPKKRERELRNQYRYQDGNVAYEFSLGAIKSLFAKGTYTADLDQGEFIPDEDEPVEDEDRDPSEAPQDDTADEPSKVVFSSWGIYASSEDGMKRVSAIGLKTPIALVSKDGLAVGYEVEVFVDRKTAGHHYITLASLATKSSFNTWVNGFSTWQALTDLQVGHLAHELRRRTGTRKAKMILTSREGVDIVLPPDAESTDDVEVIYASPNECLSSAGRAYRFRGAHVQGGAFQSDLLKAEPLVDNEETRAYFDRLFKINTAGNLGRIAGWFSAAFLCQMVRWHYKQFPLLQVWGQAGSGKSKTVELFSHLHYNLITPKKISSAGNTFFPMMAAVTQSASIPVIFEEFKPREMTKYIVDQIHNLFRTNYTGEAIERGGVNRDSANSGPVVNSYENVAPIVFMGEAVDGQSAILERCVSVSLSKEDRKGRSADFNYVFSHRRGGPMCQLGRKMLDVTMAIKLDELRDRIDGYFDGFRSRVSEDDFEDQARPWHSYAVTLAGLDLLGYALAEAFGDRYEGEIQRLKDGVIETAVTTSQKVMSEASKTLDVMAQLTRVQDVQYRLEKNVDYTSNGVHVDLKLRPAYAKYVRYQHSLKQEVLYDNDRVFEAAMRRFSGTLAVRCDDNPALYRNPYEPIFRFSAKVLADDGCEPFEETVK